nr:23S rRNA (adenine(2503)-C(2))-methyltransferase RlmN [Petrotoga sp. 9PW.55.5.1]
MKLKNILDFDYSGLQSYLINEIGIEKYRTDQICNWIYKKRVFDFEEMTNLSKQDRSFLKDNFVISIPQIIKKQVSKIDGTTKYLFGLDDGNTIESVIIYYPSRTIACISTQVGCPLRCEFCSTGQNGFVRNLTTGEIAGQLLAMEKDINIDVKNIVYMGMGEPLLNFENVLNSIEILNHPKMKKIGARHITISTAGIPHRIEELGDVDKEFRLSVSLHAPSNVQRDKIMPINHKYPVEQVMQACRIYQEKTNKRVTFEYILIKGFNDTREDALKLVELFGDMKVMVNLIPVNSNPANFEKPSKKFIDRFLDTLINKGIDAVVRAEKGSDILAACGQLKGKVKEENLR